MVPTWAPGVIRTIREVTHKSYRQLGAELGVADSSVMRWENGIVQMNEQNWGVVKRFYTVNIQSAPKTVKPEDYMIAMPVDGFPEVVFNPHVETTRQMLLNSARGQVVTVLKAICPGFENLVATAKASAMDHRNMDQENPFPPKFYWFEFCFYSYDIMDIIGEDFWNLRTFLDMARNMALGFQGRRRKISSFLNFNTDMRGGTVDLKIGCLMKD